MKVLIVEDETIVAMDLRRTLTELGHEVVASVNNGEDCLERLPEADPELVLMDIGLRGGMDGVETAMRIREKSQVPLIFLSAYTDQDTLERALAARPQAYLQKPFQEEDLAGAVGDVLQGHLTPR